VTYRLGIDLGTTYTAAAVVEEGRASIVALGNRAPVVPTVVFLREDDTILTGDSANRRAVSEPGRVAREFKRRMGDPTPMLLGGSPMSPQALMARMLRWTVDQVAQLHGGPPDVVAITHPANWGPFKLDLLSQAVRLAELDTATMLTEPEAAATYYASTQRIEPGDVVAVYDLGGGTFDAAVLRKTAEAFEILGTPEGIEHLGGIDIDEAVFAHVNDKLDGALDDLDPADSRVVVGVARLRSDCVEAKEALSTDDETVIPVLLPDVRAEVTITRAEFEAKIRPWLGDTIKALRRALRSAAVEPEELKAVLLVGGCSRIPLVARMVSEELGRPVAVDAHPKHAVALGAALAADRAAALDRGSVAPEVRVVTPPPTPGHGTLQPVGAAPPSPPAGAAAAAAGGPSSSRPPSSRRGLLIGGAIVAAVLVVGGAAMALSGGGGGGDDKAGSTSTTTSTSAPATSTTATTMAPVAVGAAGRGVRIDAITIKDGAYQVVYRTAGYDPKVSEDPTTHHIHFFFDTVAQANAGTNGPKPGLWVLYDVPSPFTKYKVSDRPAGAQQMCALVADSHHGVEVGTGNCVALPAA
jgi:actin-like ATPase involved in cell morphogenesis